MDEPTERRVQAWANYARLRSAVARAGGALGHDVIVVPLKGIWLCASGLRHPADRPMKDADLLIVGVPLFVAARRLAKAGFVLGDVPRAAGVLSMRPAEPGSPWLDLHARPLPRGLGHLTVRSLLEGARTDAEALGTPILLAEPSRMAVQLVGNVLKDRIVHASPHAAGDLEAVLCADPAMPSKVADALVAAGLRRGGAVVSQWAVDAVGGPGAEALANALEERGTSRTEARRALRAIRRTDALSPLLARTLVRAIADDPADRLLAVCAAIGQNAVHPAKARLFHSLLPR